MHHQPPTWIIPIACVAVIGLTLTPGIADTFTVTNTNDTGAGSLRQAIEDANDLAGADDIVFDAGLAGQTITWGSNPPLIRDALTINGSAASGLTISGGNAHRVFFVDAAGAAVSIQNLTIANGQATGGTGASGGGGGGLGAGGGLFVNAGDVSLSGVSFTGNAATGGAGGEGTSDDASPILPGLIGVAGGGGGGLQGAGGIPDENSGGGGGGFYGAGGRGNAGNGGGGGGLTEDGGEGFDRENGPNGGGAEGGDGSDGDTAATAGSKYGGGGGGGVGFSHAAGADGGEFGGGGGGAETDVVPADGGNGGFGGGGGGSGEQGDSFIKEAAQGGEGGFGGGGGGAARPRSIFNGDELQGTGGDGGTFGGDGGDSGTFGGGGGGGAALGGAVFVRDGATLTLTDTSETGSAITPGTGGAGFSADAGDGGDGQALGTGLFLMAQDLAVSVTTGQSTTLAGDIVESSVDGDGSALAGSSLTKTGDGTLSLTGDNTFTGGVTLNGGTLSLGSDTAAGSGDIAVLGSTIDYADGVSIANDADVQAHLTLNVDIGAATHSGNLTENGDSFALNKTGGGTLNLTGTTQLTGNHSITAGTLGLASTSNLTGVVNIADGAGLDIQAGADTAGLIVNLDAISDGRVNVTQTTDIGIQVDDQQTLTETPDPNLNLTGLSVTASGEARIAENLNLAGNVTNNGQILLLQERTLEAQTLTNAAGASLTGFGAIIVNDSGSNALDNAGTIALTGTSSIVGDVTNAGEFQLSNTGTFAFFDDVVNDGAIEVADGSSATFFGSYSGAGTLPGSGTIFFQGDLNPGNSPGTASFGGDITLENTANFNAEIAGLLDGEFDALDVAGTANLDGTLNLSYLGDFTASRGDQFTLITANSINGVFSDVSFPDQQDWFITYSTDGNVNVGVAIPIPPAAGMIPALLAIAAYRRQRKPVLP